MVQPTGESAISAPRCTSVGVSDPEVELELLGQQEVAVQRVVAVDTHAAVQVVRGEEHVLAALRGPVLRCATCAAAGTPASSRHAACHAVSLIASLLM